MDALKEIARLANHLRHGNVTLWAIADDEYCAEMGLTVEEQGETLSGFLYGVAEQIDSEVRFTEGTTGKAIEPSNLTHQRPVLDADGNRIEPAMDVWWICEGDERGVHAEKLHVDGIDGDGMVECHPYNGGTSVVLEPSELYVNKPVLDADGVPIREGDTVYLLPGGWCGEYPLLYYSAGDEMVVKEMCSDYGFGDVLMCAGDGKCDCFPLPCQLTHTKPEIDTWEQIEKDKAEKRVKELEEENEKLRKKVAKLKKRCRALVEGGE